MHLIEITLTGVSEMKITEKQKKQLEWVDRWEYDYIHAKRSHLVRCLDCKQYKLYGAASSVRDFIIRCHAGHETTYRTASSL